MAKPLERSDVLWGYVAQALNIGAGLILLPILLRNLSPEDVGLWFVFISLASLAQLLELGFLPTVARNTAYVYAGAQALGERGLPARVDAEVKLNVALLAGLIAASRKIYRIVAALAAAVLLGGGSYYISTLLGPQQHPADSLLAWAAYSGGYIASLYYGYFNGMLQGRGDVTQANKVVIASRGSLVLFGGAAVSAGYGLIGLGVASMLSSMLGRWLARRYFFAPARMEMCGIRAEKAADTGRLIRILWFNASRQGAVNLGAFLIQRGNILVASSFLGLSAAASYGMTVTILMALSGVSVVICQIQMPQMNRLQASGERQLLRAMYGEIVILACAAYMIGLAAVVIWGGQLLDLMGSSTDLLPQAAVLTLGVILLLELNHSIAASYLTTTNQVPFLWAALVSGVVTTLLSISLVHQWKIWGLILAQGGVQLMYNNWKWPHEAALHLGTKWVEILVLGARKIVENARH